LELIKLNIIDIEKSFVKMNTYAYKRETYSEIIEHNFKESAICKFIIGIIVRDIVQSVELSAHTYVTHFHYNWCCTI